MSTISVIVITLNEEKNIARCLASVAWADEIIVLDSGSKDKTIEIAKSYHAKVYHQDWLGFGEQKNKALEYTTKEWILWLDADEKVTPELSDSIKFEINHTQSDAYQMKRASFFLGKLIKHGDWGRDKVVRLFKKGKACWTIDQVHESLSINKRDTKYLEGILLHYTQDNLHTSLKKINEYSTLSAEMMVEKNRDSSVFKAVLRGHLAFVRSYLLRRGFMDGVRGYVLARNIGLGAYLKYLKCVYDFKDKK
jgi:(heptosyl)LPS beta-1,4-glucosyltransferase